MKRHLPKARVANLGAQLHEVSLTRRQVPHATYWTVLLVLDRSLESNTPDQTQ